MAGYIFSEPSDFKIIILYIVDNFGESIGNGPVTEIFLECGFTDYFTLQTCIDELHIAGLLESFGGGKDRKYIITKLGQEALNGFCDKIPKTVRASILASIKEYCVRKEKGLSVAGYYRKYNELEHMAEINVTEGGSPLLAVSINCGSEQTARAVCRKFKANPQKMYEEIIKTLTRE